MFAPFQRLGDVPEGSGVGLGLAVARGLAEAVDATIEVEDTPGGGLTMIVTVPVAVPRYDSPTPGRHRHWAFHTRSRSVPKTALSAGPSREQTQLVDNDSRQCPGHVFGPDASRTAWTVRQRTGQRVLSVSPVAWWRERRRLARQASRRRGVAPAMVAQLSWRP